MSLPLTLLVCIIAGIGAGFGTGIAGLSAAAVISPMLITFLDFNAYEAVGVALASDVLASAVSAITYGRKGHIDIKNGLVMLAAVLLCTLLGSYLASFLPLTTMGGLSMAMTLAMGIKFIVKPVLAPSESHGKRSPKKAMALSGLCGIGVGLICGFVGAGGGMMMLLVLVMVLGYDLKTAVGTSVFIMAFTAFAGSVSHFVLGGGVSDWTVLITCMITTLISARITARFATKASDTTMNRALGWGLAILGGAMILAKLLLH